MRPSSFLARRIFAIALCIVCTSIAFTQSEDSPQPTANEFELFDVVGQQDLTQTALHSVTARRGMHLGGVHVHKYADGALALYVYDSGNNRILAFLNPNWTSANELPDLVLGQNDLFTRSACNGDNSNAAALPTARTLCLNRGAHAISQEEEPRKTSMDTDPSGNLYLIDQYNNRALMFRDPFGQGDGKGDSTADAVWGQQDFGSKTCNRGAGITDGPWTPLTADGLCTTNSVPNSIDPMFVTSLDIDRWGNMWVTDIINGRVLRFPFDPNTGIPRLTADIVIGQPTMTSRTYTSDLHTPMCDSNPPGVAFCQLIALRINDATGELYVVHNYEKARIWVYRPNTTQQNPSSYSYLRRFGQGQLNYPGQIHFLDANRFLIEDEYSPFADLFRIFTTSGQLVRSFDGQIVTGLTPDSSVNFDEIHGQFTIVDGLLFVAEQRRHNSILIFDTSQLDSANRLIYRGELLGGTNNVWNTVNGMGLHSPYGMAASSTHSQLYVSGGYRILVWDVIPGVPFAGRDASYVIGQPTFATNSIMTDGSFVFRDKVLGLAVDEVNGKLWVARFQEMYVFDLPITQIAPTPVAVFRSHNINGGPGIGNLPVLGQTQKLTFRANAITIDPVDQSVWVTDTVNNRVLRIADPYTNPHVDMIIGQNQINGVRCNRGIFSAPTAKTLCFPGYAQFDSHGNLYVAEGVYEGRNDMPGNKRIVQYDRATLTAARQLGLLSEPAATRVYTVNSFTRNPMYPYFSCLFDAPCNPIGIAFDEADRMIVTSDAYFNQQNKRIYVYGDPLQTTGFVPYTAGTDHILPYSMGQGGQPATMRGNQLFVQDHTWNRVMVIRTNLKPDVIISKASAAVIENGSVDSYSIRLATRPTGTVTISLTTEPTDQIVLEPSELTFSPTNWKIPQIVVVAAADDLVSEGTHDVIIHHSAVSTDPNYAMAEVEAVAVAITDDDITSLVIGLSDEPPTVSEAGETRSLSLALDTEPVSNVTVSLIASGVVVEPDTLTMTPGDWNTPQTVIVSAVDDEIPQGLRIGTVAFEMTGGGFDFTETDILNFTVMDNDHGILINAGTLDVAEAGYTASYTLKLTTIPAAPVTVIPVGDSQCSVSSPVVFGTSDWNDEKTVTITAIDDALQEGLHGCIITHVIETKDPQYVPVVAQALSVTVMDNDHGILINAGTLDVAEAGHTASYTLKLTTIPAAPVTVIPVGDSQCSVSSPVVFGTSDWNDEKTVTITAIDDALHEGLHGCIITHVIETKDPQYVPVVAQALSVTVMDNDHGILINAGTLDVAEAGHTASYTLKLTTVPAAPVTVIPVGDSQCSVSSPVVFGTSDWNDEKTVTITAIDDALHEGLHGCIITHVIETEDPQYVPVVGPTLTVTVMDNDHGILINAGTLDVAEAGHTASYTLKLTTIPAAPVTVIPVGDSQCSVSSPVVFDMNHWNSEKTVTITAIDDALHEGLHECIITHVIETEDPQYVPVVAQALTVTVMDNDHGILINAGTLDVAEAGHTASYTLKLTTIPAAPVTVIPVGDSQCSVSSPVVFGMSDWNDEKTVTITAINDALYEGLHGCIITHVIETEDLQYVPVVAQALTVTVTDNDYLDVEVLTNNSFEDGSDSMGNPAGWTFNGRTSRDRLVCNPKKAYQGACAVRFFGGVNRTRKVSLYQTVLPSFALNTGDTLVVRAAIKMLGRPRPVKFVVYLSALDNSPQRSLVFNLRPVEGSYGVYEAPPYVATLETDHIIGVAIIPHRKTDRMWLDDVSVTVTPYSARQGDNALLPLPSLPEGMRESN